MAEKRPEVWSSASIREKKREVLKGLIEQLIWMSADLARLDMLADFSEGTDAEFGCGLNHVRDGFRDLKGALLGIMEDE